MSGGWDSVVHFWDVREGKSIKHFLGPHISGDSLDYQDGKILAGCYAARNQVQVWSFANCQKIEEIDWSGNIDDAEYIYTAGYSKQNPGLFGAGSTGKNSEVRLYKETLIG
jgi:COMPASS component SWD3